MSNKHQAGVEDSILSKVYLTDDGLWWVKEYEHDKILENIRIRRNAIDKTSVCGEARQVAVRGQIRLQGSFTSLLRKLSQLSNQYDDVLIGRSPIAGLYAYSGWSDLPLLEHLKIEKYKKLGEDVEPASFLDNLEFSQWNGCHFWMKDGATKTVRISHDRSEVKILKTKAISLVGSIDDAIARLIEFKLLMLEQNSQIGAIHSFKGKMSVVYWEPITLHEYNQLEIMSRKQEFI